MICRLTGRLVQVNEQAAVVEVGGVGYEVLVPSSSLADLHGLLDQEITLFTLQYLEGNPAASNLTPRMIGFLSAADRAFFNQFIRVRGVSIRRALRAMALPVAQLAAAIENGDKCLLASLPEIGPRVAAQIVSDLRGKLQDFCAAQAVAPPRELTEAQRIALDILVQWGDRRADAQRWLTAAVEADPSLSAPEELVRAAYRIKQTAG